MAIEHWNVSNETEFFILFKEPHVVSGYWLDSADLDLVMIYLALPVGISENYIWLKKQDCIHLPSTKSAYF